MPLIQLVIPRSSILRHCYLDCKPSKLPYKSKLKDILSALFNDKDSEHEQMKHTFDDLEKFKYDKDDSANAYLTFSMGADFGVADGLTLIDCKIHSMTLFQDKDSDEEIGTEESKEE